jgi:hypothetical protein
MRYKFTLPTPPLGREFAVARKIDSPKNRNILALLAGPCDEEPSKFELVRLLSTLALRIESRAYSDPLRNSDRGFQFLGARILPKGNSSWRPAV